MALEALDNQNPKMPGGYTTCSKCNRLILTEHADANGACGGCTTVPAATPVAEAQTAQDEPEDLMRDTYPALDYNHDEGD